MSETTSNQYSPDTVSPPGTSLKETLEVLGMTQVTLARRVGRTEKTITGIVRGEEPVTPELALSLERVLRTPASFWNNRERRYREFLAEKE